MLKKALTIPLSARGSGLPAAISARGGKDGEGADEKGRWHYLVTDCAGIRPRLDSCYSKQSKSSAQRFTLGTVVEVNRRRKAGWTKWLCLTSGEGWLFDVSPKDRKVRCVEVEVQFGDWDYEICADRLVVMPRPQFAMTPITARHSLQIGDEVKVVERVRPIIGRGAFLRLARPEGWVLDFIDGQQTVRSCRHPQDSIIDGATDQDDATDTTDPGDLSPLRRMSTQDSSLGEPELGEWRYVVLDPKGITLRSRPTYDRAAKLRARLEEGEIVTVVERRERADTRFLRIDVCGSSGWAFEQQPGCAIVRMTEVALDNGSWFYRIISDKGCALRSRCSTSAGSKAGMGPQKGAIVRVGQRVKVGSTTFLRLRDGSGWIFDQKDGKSIVEGPLNVQPMRSAVATICADDGTQLFASPTEEAWAKTKMVLLNNAKVTVNFRVPINGMEWMEVSKPGGMQGWLPAKAVELENAVFNSPGWAR
mmetsp:Transcript_122693/g.308574  ORF Transcript_122693/g.308574 Transcript_122693/m.308574 type:complete len:477 (+) Transcript_122693:137-1567(+)